MALLLLFQKISCTANEKPCSANPPEVPAIYFEVKIK